MSTREQETDRGTSRAQFPATQWTVILSAGHQDGPQADDALASLCGAYWFPLYAYARRRGHSHHEAEDLTQEYFGRLQSKEMLSGLERDGGKFRSFLLTTFKHFLANEWHRTQAEKRGGGAPMVSIDEGAEERYIRELVTESTPESVFETQWALTVLDRVLKRIELEYATVKRKPVFDALRGCLPGGHAEACYQDASIALRTSETAVRMAAHRLRRRYGELLRAEIGATVAKPEDVESEIRELIEAVGQR